MNHADESTTRIHEWLSQNFPLAQARDVGFDDSLLDSGIIDSLGILEVVQFLESEFGVHVNDEEMMPENFETINGISIFVNSKREPVSREPEAN